MSVAAVVALAAAACGDEPASPGATAAAQVAATTENFTASPTDVVLEWGDEFEHLVVVTENSPLADVDDDIIGDDRSDDVDADDGSGADVAPPSAGADVAPDHDAELADEADASNDGAVTVRYLDGTEQRVVVPAESLLALSIVTPTQRALIDDPDVLLLVADPNGVVGPAGARYARTADTLIQYTDAPIEMATGTAIVDRDTESNASSADDAELLIVDAPGSPAPADTGTAPSGLTDSEIVEQLAEMPGVVEVIDRGFGVLAVSTVDVATAELVATVPGVVSVSPDFLMELTTAATEPRESQQWAIRNTTNHGVDPGFPAAWTRSQGAGVLVAVVDSGVSFTHPDLVDRMWTNPTETCGSGFDADDNGFPGDCRGWNFGSNNWDSSATINHHGTQVAGLVAASRNGVGIIGAAPEAQIMSVKVISESNTIALSSVSVAIIYAVDNGADIINLSVASTDRLHRSQVGYMEAAVQHARNHGVLLVAGAANRSTALMVGSSAYWPAGFAAYYDNVLAVGSHDNRDQRSPFSNFGHPVSVYAPGSDTLTTDTHSTWVSKYGTSMSAPYVAGAAALIKSAGVATDPAQIRHLIDSTTIPTSYGARLDAAAAIGVDRSVMEPVVEMFGADTLVPDEQGRFTIRVRHHDDNPITQVRVSVATRHEARVYAVDGLIAQIDDSTGTLAVASTGATGVFPTFALRDQAAVTGDGADLDLTMSVPEGLYAIVAEPLTASGVVLGSAWVSYVSVGDTTIATPPAPTNPPTAPAPPPTTTQPPPGSPTPAPAPPPTTTQPPTGSPVPSDPPATTQPPATGSPTPAPPPATTPPPGTGSPAPSDPPATTQPPATPAPSDPPPTTHPPSTGSPSQPPVTTQPPGSGSPSPTPAPTTTQPPTSGSPSEPPTTTPAPDPVADGDWRLDGITPRDAIVTGGGQTTITGVVPPNVPVYVWFGDLAIVRGTVTSTGIDVTIPAVNTAATVDVHVKFRTNVDHSLTLEDAFTFHPVPDTSPPPAPGDPTQPPGTSSPTPTTQAPPTTQPPGPGSPTPTEPPPTTRPPATTQPPASGSPTPTQPPATTQPPSTASPTPTQPPATTAPEPVAIQRGDLTLRPTSTGTAIHRLPTHGWPNPGCTTTACTPRRL